MVDVLLMRSLLRATPSGTHLIMVGDADQLPPVGPGNVLRDVIASGVVPVIMLMHMPALTAAPQQPQNPHEPPGQRAPRFFISARHAVRSMSPPAFLYAVMSAAPTIV